MVTAHKHAGAAEAPEHRDAEDERGSAYHPAVDVIVMREILRYAGVVPGNCMGTFDLS